jgi:NAD(P)-dependent dehydrogenase (short-subunit alcohol dehydrogenase family)
MATPPVLLILGAGPNIGAATARTFLAAGYRVALASRTNKSPVPDTIHVTVDLTRPETLESVFESTASQLGAWPSVVVYNAGIALFENKVDPLASESLTKIDDLKNVYNGMTISPAVTAQLANRGFKTLGADSSKTVIFTGNIMNHVVMPGMANMTAGRTALASLVRNWAEVGDYAKDGIS